MVRGSGVYMGRFFFYFKGLDFKDQPASDEGELPAAKNTV